MTKLNSQQKELHERAIRLSREHRSIEQQLVETFISIDETKLYHKLDKPSLFQYATETLGLTEAVAYNLIAVSRKAARVPVLREALASQKLSASKAGRIVSHVEGNEHLVEFACNHTVREIEFEIAKLNPAIKPRDRIRVLSEDQVELTVTVDRATFDALQRIQSLLAQRDLPASLSDAVSETAHQYVVRKDPVKKAELCTNRVAQAIVHRRDKGRCTHIDDSGKRCNSDRWIEIHHIVPKSMGGTDDPENLTTLCSFHHRQLHRSGLQDPTNFVHYTG